MPPPKTIDRYEIKDLLGTGAMGSVYSAWDPKLHRDVALKLVSTDVSKESKSRQRFQREARAVAALRHPNIVEIYDYSGQDSERLYLVMEKLDGDDLFNIVNDRGPMPEAATAAVGHELASALQVAHEAGIIHRDLKPENVFMNSAGRVVLTDFGIVKAVRENQAVEGWNKETDVIGTPGFMAPELMMGKELGPYTDVFALGALMYNIATGKLPYDGVAPVEMFRAMMAGSYDDPRKYNRLLSDELCTVLAATLQPKPKKRMQTVSAFRDGMKEVLEANGVTDLRDDLREYMQDPNAYSESSKQRTARYLLERMKIAIKDKDSDGAERIRLRLAAIDPDNEDVFSVTGVAHVGKPVKSGEAVSRQPEKRGGAVFIGVGAGLATLAIGIAGFLFLRTPPTGEVPPAGAAPVEVDELAPVHETPPPAAVVASTIHLTVTVRGGNGVLFLDGQKVGRGQNHVVEVPAGEHTVEVRGRGKKLRKTLTLSAERPKPELVADLKRGKLVLK